MLYWFFVLVPIAMIILAYYELQNNCWVIFLLVYVIVYRPLLDGMRLVKLNLINKSEVWKLLIPFYRIRFFKQLYFDLH